MKFPQNILVIISGKRENPIALSRALQFAQFYDIQLHLLSCVYDPGTDLSPLLPKTQKETLKKQKIAQREGFLEKIKAQVEAKGIPVTSKVVWHRKVQNAVIEYCEKTTPDLMVKRISDNASSINPFNMPMDWQLLRNCPSPLLLVKEEKWDPQAPILAAVNAASENPKEKAFNKVIVEYSQMLSRLTNAAPHFVTTHIAPLVDNAIDIPGFDPAELSKEVNEYNHKQLNALLKDQNIPAENMHVIEGLAEERIPMLAKDIGCQIVVLGTIGRSGLKGAMMGNTAEQVLTHLQCEVLALRP